MGNKKVNAAEIDRLWAQYAPVDIKRVKWGTDDETREYVRENAEKLTDPLAMTTKELREAVCHCVTLNNPYTKALIYKAGAYEKYKLASYDDERQAAVAKKVLKGFGFLY